MNVRLTKDRKFREVQVKKKGEQLPKTVINSLGGFEIIEESYNKLTIDPDELRTGDSSLRYNVTARLLGRLERLAKSRFEIKKLTDKDIDEWRNVDDECHWEIAQSVNASSEIENEHIRADELSLVLAAVTGAEDRVVTEELSDRAVAVKSIYETYLWTLTLDRKTYMDFDLVLEIHSRMFVTTKPELAGQLKSKDVSIKGAGYDVKTLPPAKVMKFMRALCESTDRRLLKARNHAEESMLLIIAEFILDFLAIHPFPDGNGRTARLLSTYLLLISKNLQPDSWSKFLRGRSPSWVFSRNGVCHGHESHSVSVWDVAV